MKKKRKEVKGIVFGLCKPNNKEIWLSKNSSAYAIYVSWLYYSNNMIKHFFVYKHILM